MLKFGNFHMIDSGGYRSFVAPLDEFFNRHVFSLGDNFDPTIRQVFGAAFYSKMFGFVLGKRRK